MPLNTSDFQLSLTSHGALNDYVSETNLLLRTTTQALVPFDSELPSTLTIRVFTVTWSCRDDSIPPTECLYSLHRTISNFLSETSTSLIAVQCRDGWGTSGQFCAAYNVMASLAIDKSVDVYLLTRTVQNRMSQTMSQNEYSYLYRLCQEYHCQEKTTVI